MKDYVLFITSVFFTCSFFERVFFDQKRSLLTIVKQKKVYERSKLLLYFYEQIYRCNSLAVKAIEDDGICRKLFEIKMIDKMGRGF